MESVRESLDGPSLFERVYDQLRGIAAAHMAGERTDHTLQPTALVHEAYLRIVGEGGDWESERYFFGAAAEAMRRILIEHARRRGTLRRGGGRVRVGIDEAESEAIGEPPPDLLVLNEALERMERQEPRIAEVVKLRFFAGLSIAETARVMGVSPMTVKRAWSCGHAWLHGEVFGEDG